METPSQLASAPVPERSLVMSRPGWVLPLGLALLISGAVSGCGPSDGNTADGAVDSGVADDAGEGEDATVCAPEDLCGPFDQCCEQGEECVNDWQCLPLCATVRCGANLEDCCDAGQICPDGVSCVADCGADQELCGEDLDTCCDPEQVCLGNVCTQPGTPCDDMFDCPDDSWYCEPTLGSCLPLVSGPVCEGEPEFTAIEPVVEWYWPGIQWNGHHYDQVVAAPSVGDVTGDGVPDVMVVAYWNDMAVHDDTVLVVLSGGGDGQGGGLALRTIPNDPSGPRPYGLGTVALANFNGDPQLEMVYQLPGGGVRIVDDDGIDVCDSASYPGCSGIRRTDAVGTEPTPGALSVADLDHDGMPDIIYRCQAFNGRNIGDPSLDFTHARPDCGPSTVVADLDEDGRPEIIDGATAVTVDPAVPGGVSFWPPTPANRPLGFLAVADILPDVPGPEVINIKRLLYVLDGQTGQVLIGPGGSILDANIMIPGGGDGGAPNVADFDGDGLPEIGVAGLEAYVVFDPDCWDPPLRAGGQCISGTTDLQLWTTPTQDLSSSVTGSSLFDFQGDGIPEVLYNDECFLHIYSGTDGTPATATPIPSSSRTSSEYPIVADVDGDGNAEIVSISTRFDCAAAWKTAGIDIDTLCQMTDCIPGPACPTGVCMDPIGVELPDYQCDSHQVCQRAGGTYGVRVYGDANDRWVRTRPVWPQYSYHVTDFVFSGGVWNVPVHEVPSWTTTNSYRQNVQGGVLFPVPDLQVTLEASPECPSTVNLVAQVINLGSSGIAAGVTVEIYRTDDNAQSPPELVTTLTTSKNLLPGAWERLATTYPVPDVEIAMTFQALVDPNDEVEECHEDNNQSIEVTADCPPVVQ